MYARSCMYNQMEMDDELADFIREHKTRVAEDKASLQQDPPYIEINAKLPRTYGSTVKENIPPTPFTQVKEESCNVGLPLGMEYERKKQRLQHELRMDYRRYMAQKNHLKPRESGPLIHRENGRSVKQYLLEDQTDLLPKQWTPLLRDAATLTDLHLTEAATLGPDEEGHSSHPRKRCDRMDQVLEDEDLQMTEGRRGRYARVGSSYEKRQPSKTDGGKTDNPVGVAGAGRRLRTHTNKEDAEFSTGLIIGASDTVEALQRRKERYRQELQEQIAEQYENRKREKDLELKVAATGANDPEKQPDRIRQFGLGRRKNHQVLEILAPTEIDSTSLSKAVQNNARIGVEDPEMPPPEHPHVAFQSPLLEYSSALGLAGGGSGLSPNSYPAAPTFLRSVDTPRLPFFPPHPPSALSEGFSNSNPDSHNYFGAKNLIDPNMAYYGQMSYPSGLPLSYWNVPAGGALDSHLDHHSRHSRNSDCSFPEPQMQPNHESSTMDSRARVFPFERARSTRNSILNYRESLKLQIQEQQERKRLEREESERYEAQLEADMKTHHPWGRGGGGAPLRDSTGNLIADLNQMHKQNEEANSNPEQWQRRAKVAVIANRADHTDRASGAEAEGSVRDCNDGVDGFPHVNVPQFARGNVFANQPTQQQLQEQDKYKTYLKEQIEEKIRQKAKERERIRLEEEKEEKRLSEQRACIQREYEEEQEKKKRKEMEQKAKNEELIHLAEQRKKEAERRKKEEEEKESEALRRQYERERQARLEEVPRDPSPPIPTLQKKHGLRQRPTADSHHSTVHVSERSLSGLQSPPVPACRNQLRAAGDQCDVVSELSALRRQLRSEQKRLEGRLQQDNREVFDSPLSDRHFERPAVDVFDMARLRLQAPVRRPGSRNLEPRNLLQIHDSLQLKNADGESRLGFTNAPKMEDVGVSGRKWWDYWDVQNRNSSQRSTVQDDFYDRSPPQQHDDLGIVNVGYPRGSLLESESAFIDPLGDAFPVLNTSDLDGAPQLSARERRRLAKQLQHPQERGASSCYTGYNEGHSTLTGSRLQLEAESRGKGRSQDRTGHRRALDHCDNTTGPVDQSDDNDNSWFSLHNRNHRTSQAAVATDIWMRPGTSETLARSDRTSRREQFAT